MKRFVLIKNLTLYLYERGYIIKLIIFLASLLRFTINKAKTPLCISFSPYYAVIHVSTLPVIEVAVKIRTVYIKQYSVHYSAFRVTCYISCFIG